MAPVPELHHKPLCSQFTYNVICHSIGLTVLPFFMYYLSRFLRLKLLGDTINQQEVNRDTAVIARIFACVNLFVDFAAATIYTLGLYESRGEFEIFIALLDVAMTASWVCVCLIPLELYCTRRKQDDEVNDWENQKKHPQVEDGRVADEKAPLFGNE